MNKMMTTTMKVWVGAVFVLRFAFILVFVSRLVCLCRCRRRRQEEEEEAQEDLNYDSNNYDYDYKYNDFSYDRINETERRTCWLSCDRSQ